MNSPAGRYAKGFGLRGLGAMVAYPVIDQLLQNVDTESGPGNYIEAALQGAAGGYTVGGPWGAAIGAVANPITDAIFGKSATEAIADAEIPILSGFFGGPFMPEQVDPQLQSLVDAGFASDPEDAKRRLAKMEMYQSVMGLQPGPQLFNAVFGDMQQIADPALERAKVVGQMMQPFTDSYRRSTEAFDAQLANIGGMSPGVAQAYQAWGPLNSALSNQYADIMGSNAMAQALANAANNPDMTGVADSGLLDALLGG